MSHALADLPTLTIANGATATAAITSGLDDADWITIFAPATLTGTITVQVSNATADEIAAATDSSIFRDLTMVDSTTDVTVPAGNAVAVRQNGFRALRLSSSAAEGAARSFPVMKQFATR